MHLIIVFLLFTSVYYLPGTGGAGVALPYNLIFTGWLGGVAIVMAWRYKLRVSPVPQPLLGVGCALLLLPWLFQSHNNPGVWVLLAALVLWQVLRHFPFTPRHKRIVLQAVLMLALAQAVIGLMQAFSPALAARLYEFDWLRNHGRPYGIFQQVNLLASFLATGLGCGLLLLLTERRRYLPFLYVLVLGLLAFCITLTQSRAGALGAVFVIAALVWVRGRYALSRSLTALTVMALCAALAWYVTQHVQIMVNGEPYLLARHYEASTHERWNILLIAWQMIMQHPWAGWGYGSFEYEFSRYVLAHPELSYTYSSIVTHPHNELLYAWFQGGIVALAGVLMLLAGWVTMIFRAWQRHRLSLGYTLLVIPLLVHLNLEYPFYQSFIHLALFVVLMRLGVVDKTAYIPALPAYGQRAIGMAVGIALIAFSITGLVANNQLTALERSGFNDFPTPAPWYFSTQFERAHFDAMVALLMRYNITRNPADLALFDAQAEQYLRRHNDKNVWRSRMMIAQFKGESEKVAQMQKMYGRLFPVPAQ